MPRFKQPISLQKLAFDSLIGYVVNYCDALSIKGLLTELRQVVAVFKHHVRDHIPGILFAQFCRKFLDKFYSVRYQRSKNRPASHQRAALEIMMDVEIVGLTCGGDMVQYLDPSDVHRIHGLRILDWRELQHCRHAPRGLENYRLQDLTTFIFHRICTDGDLEIIGSRCLKLEILDVHASKKVTDRGLRALRPCSGLRIINLHYCSVSDDGVNELLNFHKKLEEFNVGTFFTSGEKSFDILSRPISLVCPSVKRFALKPDHVTNAHLYSVVALFPNLTYLEFCRPLTGDLRILKDLKSLTELELGMYSGGFSMENLKELLTSIGANISRLALESNVCVTQNDLNDIFKVCGDVEKLWICYKPSRPKDKLIIPPFQKLKYLDCVAHTPLCDHAGSYEVELDFCKMLSLEVLRIQNFHGIFRMTELMMLDNAKFPNLREVRTFYNHNEHTDRINRIAKSNNLDFELRFSQ